MFAYFPTYTVGTLYAAQLIEAYEREHSLADEIARGEFSGLLAWLKTNVYALGDRVTAEDIIRNATGGGLDAAAYFRHVEAKLR